MTTHFVRSFNSRIVVTLLRVVKKSCFFRTFKFYFTKVFSITILWKVQHGKLEILCNALRCHCAICFLPFTMSTPLGYITLRFYDVSDSDQLSTITKKLEQKKIFQNFCKMFSEVLSQRVITWPALLSIFQQNQQNLYDIFVNCFFRHFKITYKRNDVHEF